MLTVLEQGAECTSRRTGEVQEVIWGMRIMLCECGNVNGHIDETPVVNRAAILLSCFVFGVLFSAQVFLSHVICVVFQHLLHRSPEIDKERLFCIYCCSLPLVM